MYVIVVQNETNLKEIYEKLLFLDILIDHFIEKIIRSVAYYNLKNVVYNFFMEDDILVKIKNETFEEGEEINVNVMNDNLDIHTHEINESIKKFNMPF